MVNVSIFLNLFGLIIYIRYLCNNKQIELLTKKRRI